MENNKYYNLIPSARGSFGFAWRKIFEKSFLPLLVAVIILGILNGPISGGTKWNFDGDFHWPFLFIFPLALFALAYSFLFLPVVEYGQDLLFLKAMRDEEADLKILFEGFRDKYLKIVLANLIVTALVMLGLVMLIIPAIIIGVRLVFVSYLVMDKNMEPMQAVEKSWQMTRGYGWKIFGMAILSFFIFIGGLMLCGVGIILSFIWVHAAFASMYLAISNQTDEDNPIPILGVNEA